MELFWRIAPIPSGRYPGTVIYWPIWATMRSIWIKGLQVGLFRVGWIVYSFIIGTGLYLLFDLVFHLPATYIALGSGIGMMTPTASSYLIGGILGIFFRRKMGDEFWNEYKRIIASGIAIGAGVAIAISLAVAIIIQSIWTIPV